MGSKAKISVKWSVLRLINFVRNEKVTKFD